MGIGERIKQLRTKLGLSGERFGELCGVTKGMVSQWEKELSTPSADRLIELRRIARKRYSMDFSLDWIYTGELSSATEIELALSVQDRQRWYRLGRALAEPLVDSSTDERNPGQSERSDAIKRDLRRSK
jgi:transcriptional regulator with XRE-family HTH domain